MVFAPETDEIEDVQQNRADELGSELEHYLNVMKMKQSTEELTEIHNNPLIWWKEHEAEYPLLTKVARGVFVILPASASAERLFSWAKQILCDRRSCLKAVTVKMLAALKHHEGLIDLEELLHGIE